jgi:hypothetical protein
MRTTTIPTSSRTLGFVPIREWFIMETSFVSAFRRPLSTFNPRRPPPPPGNLIILSFTHLEQKRHFQYFSFRSTLNASSPAFADKKPVRVRYVAENAGEASYADAFGGYSTFVATGPDPVRPERVDEDVRLVLRRRPTRLDPRSRIAGR